MVALALAALLSQQLVPHGANPVLLNAVEESVIMDGDQCDDWFKVVQTHRIYYAYATDPYCQAWTLGNGGQPVLPGGYVYPNVFKVGATYYMTTVYAGDYHLYLWRSTDKVTWSLANNGQPILHHGTSNAQWFYTLINTSVAVDSSGRWHLLIEGKDNLGNNFHTGYSYSTLAEGPNFDTHLSASPVFGGTTGNPWLVYVPERNALLAVAGAIPNVTWVLRAWSGAIGADLTQAANWTPATGFGMQTAGVHLTDPSLVFSGTKPWGTMLAYHYNQLDAWRAYGPTSVTEFFDTVTVPTGTQSNVLELGAFGDTSLVRLDANTIGAGAGGGGTIQAAVFRGRLQMPNGGCSAPSAFFGSSSQTGLYLDAASVGACVNGVPVFSAGPTGSVAKGFAIWGVTSAPIGGINLAPGGDVQFGGQRAMTGDGLFIAPGQFGAGATLHPDSLHSSLRLTIGTSPGSIGVLALPTAKNGWTCMFTNRTTPTSAVYALSDTATSVTVTSSGWSTGDVISGTCWPY